MKETIAENEFLESEHQKNLIRDQELLILKGSKPLLYLNKIVKLGFIDNLIYDMAKFHIIRSQNKWKKSPYQPVLEEILADINTLLSDSDDLPDSLEIQYRDIRGFDLFNASASPWFGENILQVQSGLFWFSHIIARSLEPFIIKELVNEKLKFPEKHYRKKFYNSLIAFVTKDHTKSFSMFHLIFEKESILTGIETFIVAHEYAHLLIAEYGIETINYKKFYSEALFNRIILDEEIAADALGLIILEKFSNKINDDLILYSPRLLFLILSKLESSKLIPSPVEHPTNISRYNYIKEMLLDIGHVFDYDNIDNIISKIYFDGESKIKLKSSKINASKSKVKNMFQELQERMILKGNKELINFE